MSIVSAILLRLSHWRRRHCNIRLLEEPSRFLAERFVDLQKVSAGNYVATVWMNREKGLESIIDSALSQEPPW
jgi:hypothetical protein